MKKISNFSESMCIKSVGEVPPTNTPRPKIEYNKRKGKKMKFEDIPKIIRDRMNVDELIFGNAFCLLENGRYKRVDPMKVKLNRNSGEYEIIDEKEELLGINMSNGKNTTKVFGIKHKDGTATATRMELLRERNPAHYCMNCDKYLGFRGFCSRKCHDKWYDSLYTKEEPIIRSRSFFPEKGDGLPKKTLSDKIQPGKKGCCEPYIEIKDVKEHLRNVLNKMGFNKDIDANHHVIITFKEEFGGGC